MFKQLPNALTMFRLVMAGVFLVVLNQYRYPAGPNWVLWLAMGLFIFASITDVLDGYLARKWQAETAFGRIMDPFCDKVLVLGAFIFLAGERFVDPQLVEQDQFFNMVSGVYPWMVATMLARELLVTGIRGEMESQGKQFGAKLSGKLKTLLQVITIPTVIGLVALDPQADGHQAVAIIRDVFVYLTVIVTFLSGLPYIQAAIKATRHR